MDTQQQNISEIYLTFDALDSIKMLPCPKQIYSMKIYAERMVQIDWRYLCNTSAICYHFRCLIYEFKANVNAIGNQQKVQILIYMGFRTNIHTIDQQTKKNTEYINTCHHSQANCHQQIPITLE